jgi:hypothetical protein
MTEPEVAGSDPKLLRTTAVRDGDHYVINGHKWFSSGAHGAAFAIVMAKTNPENENPHLRFSQIIVPTDTPGFRIERGIPVMGDDDNHHAEIRYEDCRVPVTNRLGEEGLGFVIAQERLGPGRIPPLHAVARDGTARLRDDVPLRQRARGLRLYARAQGERPGLGRRGARRHPGRASPDAPRRVEDRHRRGKAARGKRSRSSSSSAPRAPRRRRPRDPGARRRGLTEDHPLSTFYRQARAARIYDGPDEVHKMVVARRSWRSTREPDEDVRAHSGAARSERAEPTRAVDRRSSSRERTARGSRSCTSSSGSRTFRSPRSGASTTISGSARSGR